MFKLFFRAILALVGFACVAQWRSDLRPVESPSAFAPSRGTLVLVLANPKGFVIASDSRRTLTDKRTKDDSQKLFELSPSAALGIAGFAANLEPPFRTSIAGEIGVGLKDFRDASPEKWVEDTVGRSLPILRLIAWAEGATQEISAVGVLARFGADGIPQVTKIDIGATQTNRTGIKAERFVCVRAGITDRVDAVMTGEYVGRNTILKRLSKNGGLDLDQASASTLAEIARTLVEYTEQFDDHAVGGPVQLGVFPIGADRYWTLPVRAANPPAFGAIQKIDHTTRVGVGIGPGLPGTSLTITTDSIFRGGTIIADNNVFVNNVFYNVEFRLSGDMPKYFRKNGTGAV